MSNRPVVVLTALDLERQAIEQGLEDVRPYLHQHGTRFRRGRVSGGTSEVVLALVGKGNHSAAVLAERAMAEFRPAAVIFVGVAGALQSQIELGDVVVATHVYAYHGALSENDGMKSRPRVWETSHSADQLARELAGDGAWWKPTSAGSVRPSVHFGPIAAGEVVLNSADAPPGRWVEAHYNDALAIEMESAGVAQAGHLNGSLPVVVVRGISDRADGSKMAATDRKRQPEAARHAAAFALAMAEQLGRSAPSQPHDARPTERRTAMSGSHQNIAMGNARVGVQAGTIYGGVRMGADQDQELDLAKEIKQFRLDLDQARREGRLDEATYEAAAAELAVVDASIISEKPASTGLVVVALKKLRGLVGDLADLASKLSTILTLVRGLT
ncbi:5'-methylthioadenosine/S-adenosylhomocysteine nucleosidase [Kineosporia sp. NBRC 101731]|uniref:5'-methylthioadenosine/S-adenosylhomocysteine nucleosidase family protein n=1 Tax=Kineosporia sp. NBRC 101731 TaxID=3032199 RepID=UPI0024A4DF64|nr:5'-methylthioadenosine/S-adenosylhomocysteine nucleosidase [Kineosporia sp. NBRC 101731]GLY32536.1 hypothetical protein Kisp02_59010 [Kineosporia sp. NBRC 101731]